MPTIRVAALFDHDNGIPADQVVNTFHFAASDSGPTTADAAFLATEVSNFFAEVISGQARQLGTWLSPLYDNVVTKAYVVNDTIVDGKLVSNSGAPVAATSPVALGTKMSAQPLPAEVAVCLSVRNTTAAAVPRARRTGRIYFGPLNYAALNLLNNNAPKPTTDLTADLRLAADRLRDRVAARTGTQWVIYSRPYGGREAIPRPGRTTLPALAARAAASYNVEQVWTDDAFDTQRRRGQKATAKTILQVA